jgi:hypothetical protein
VESSFACQAPWCRELLALLAHGEVRLRGIKQGRKVASYHAEWHDWESGGGRTYEGDGETLQAAIEAAVIDRFGILSPCDAARTDTA